MILLSWIIHAALVKKLRVEVNTELVLEDWLSLFHIRPGCGQFALWGDTK